MRQRKVAVVLGLFAAEAALGSYYTHELDKKTKLNLLQRVQKGVEMALVWNAAVLPPAFALLYASK